MNWPFCCILVFFPRNCTIFRIGTCNNEYLYDLFLIILILIMLEFFFHIFFYKICKIGSDDKQKDSYSYCTFCFIDAIEKCCGWINIILVFSKLTKFPLFQSWWYIKLFLNIELNPTKCTWRRYTRLNVFSTND